VSQRIVIESHAKINLYLEVLAKRDDGFNNIETIFQTVSLADTLTLEAADALTFTCDDPALAAEPDNLVERAARALLAHAGVTRGARMHLAKRIPVAAGLAGGSGDAAAALFGLNQLWQLGVDDTALATLALALGSDVPYCLRGGTALATGRGEVIAGLDELPESWFVLVHPPVGVSAGWVYRHPGLARNIEVPVAGRTPRFARALEALSRGDLAACVFNGMEGVVFAEHPQLAAWKSELLAHGCTAAAMSGSGSTLFGIARDAAHAREVAARFPGVRTSVVRSVAQGLRRVE
jgi:4-diphosphocytidyl-2-C-methyl-D-erythritol kinase